MDRHLFWRHPLRVLLCLLIISAPDTRAADETTRPPLVVASFSILGDFVAAVGGDRIELQVLVGPDSDAHLYQPTPADSRLLREADLVVINGMGFEGWMERLVAASGYRGEVLTASTGITPLYVHAGTLREPDPHAWQSVANVRHYVRNVAAALRALRPADADYYSGREAAYLVHLDALEQELQTGLAQVPAAQRSIVTSHDAFGYFAQAYGLRVLAPLGLNTDSEASARAVARLIRQIRAEGIRAVFVENITDPRLLQRITHESGARIGGVLYSDALSSAAGPAPDYLSLQRHNLHTLLAALLPAAPTSALPGDQP